MKAKYLLILVFVFVSFLVNAQKNGKKALLEAINKDIWKPFSEAYQSLQAEKYLALHSKDLIRAEGGAKQVKNLVQYSENVRKMFDNLNQSGSKVTINFRFLERIINQESASERGIFEFALTNTKSEKQQFYGKFHVFSRQEKGVWKILVDYDSNENGTINAESYKAAFGLEEFEKYE